MEEKGEMREEREQEKERRKIANLAYLTEYAISLF